MEPGVEGSLAGEVRQDLRFETVTCPMRCDFLVEDEESGINPRVADDGLLGEAFDLPVLIELKGAELRAEGDGGDRGQSSAGVVEVEEGGEVDVSETVSVGGKKLIANMVEAGEDAIAGIGFDAGVEDFDLPIGKTAFEVVEEHLLAMTGGEDEAAKTIPRVNLHEMDEDGTPLDGHHGLGEVFGEGINARSLAAAKNDDFKIVLSFYFRGHADSMKRM